MRTIATEGETQRAILDLLAAMRIFAGRLNTGAGFINGRPVLHHTFGKGCADILALYPDRGLFMPLWIECKAAKGKQSPEQRSFEEHVLNLGHWYLVARSVEDVREFLKGL